MHAAATPLPPAGLRGRGEVRARPVSTEGHIQGPESNQTTTTRGSSRRGRFAFAHSQPREAWPAGGVRPLSCR